jgi:hypothetical protein
MNIIRLLILSTALTLTMAGHSYAQQNPPRPPRPPRDRGNGAEVSEPFSQTFKVGASSELAVVNNRGDIFVSAGNTGQIQVSATRTARGRTDQDARTRLWGDPIAVHAAGNRVELRSEPGAGNVEVEFDIKVPPDCTVDVRTASGDIRVVNVKGEFRATTASGDVTLDGVSRIAFIRAISGDVQITNGGGAAATNVTTVSGNVIANGMTAQNLDLNAISGDVRLTGWTGNHIRARLLSGNFDLAGTLGKSGRYDIESHSGNIRFALDDQPGFEIDASTFNGSIRVDFSVKSEGPVRAEPGRQRALRGTYGDGSAIVHVQTFNGNITVTKK